MPNLERRQYTRIAEAPNKSEESVTGQQIFQKAVSSLQGDPVVHREIVQTFDTAFRANLNILPTKNQLIDYQRKTSATDSRDVANPPDIENGDFNFGGDVEAFVGSVMIFDSLVGVSAMITTQRIIGELDNYAVLVRNKIPAEFHLLIGVNKETDRLVDTLAIKPIFSENIAFEDKKRSLEGVILVSSELSEHDN